MLRIAYTCLLLPGVVDAQHEGFGMLQIHKMQVQEDCSKDGCKPKVTENPVVCCEAISAVCEACKSGKSPHEFCVTNPKMNGCDLILKPPAGKKCIGDLVWDDLADCTSTCKIQCKYNSTLVGIDEESSKCWAAEHGFVTTGCGGYAFSSTYNTKGLYVYQANNPSYPNCAFFGIGGTRNDKIKAVSAPKFRPDLSATTVSTSPIETSPIETVCQQPPAAKCACPTEKPILMNITDGTCVEKCAAP